MDAQFKVGDIVYFYDNYNRSRCGYIVQIDNHYQVPAYMIKSKDGEEQYYFRAWKDISHGAYNELLKDQGAPQ
jgi:hypothetical protein